MPIMTDQQQVLRTLGDNNAMRQQEFLDRAAELHGSLHAINHENLLRMQAGNAYGELTGQYSYWEREVPRAVGEMPQENNIEHPAPVAQVHLSRSQEKARENTAQNMHRANENLERSAAEILGARMDMLERGAFDENIIAMEREFLEKKFEAINASMEYALNEAKLANLGDGLTLETLKIKYKAAIDTAAAWGEYADSMLSGYESGSARAVKARKKAISNKLSAEKKAQSYKQDIKLEEHKGMNDYAKLKETRLKHGFYDFVKSIALWHDYDTSLEKVDAVYETGSHKFVNIGRAYMGGTKPMYIFEDRNAPIMGMVNGQQQTVGYKQYLFKAPVNCCGVYKPEGALLTEAASRLQQRISVHSIDAICAYDEQGQVIGSFQERIDTMQGGFDLFGWQLDIEGRDEVEDQNDRIPQAIVNQVLREHALDWLLCNFDTKGENFLQMAGSGDLCSFDKEASFNKIMDEGAQHMSYTYKPHNNNTIYNTIFRLYTQGKLNIDTNILRDSARNAMSIPDNEYLDMFDEMLEFKSKGNAQKRAELERRVLGRKTGLMEEYDNFINMLERDRAANLAARQG